MHDTDPGHAAEQFARQVARAAVAGGPVIDFSRTRPQPGDQRLRGFDGKARLREQHERHRRERRDQLQLAHRIVIRPLKEMRVDHHGRVAREQQHVPVGRRFRDIAGTARRNRTRLALQGHRVSRVRADRLRRDARQRIRNRRRCVLRDHPVSACHPRSAADVGRPADWVRNHDLDRLRGEGLRHCAGGVQHQAHSDVNCLTHVLSISYVYILLSTPADHSALTWLSTIRPPPGRR